MTGVTYAGTEVTYNGEVHSIVAENLPEGVTASYENNENITAGEHTVTSNFTAIMPQQVLLYMTKVINATPFSKKNYFFISINI